MKEAKESFLSESQRELLKKTMLEPFSDLEKEHFLIVVERTHLDPFARQIYAVPQRNKARNPSPKHEGDEWIWKTVLCTIVSIEGLRTIAERTGEYLGQVDPKWCGKDGQWNDVWMDNEAYPYAAKAGVRRKGFPEPLVAVARFGSFVQTIRVGQGQNAKEVPTQFWKKAPDVMLLKVAEAHALRRAFPQQLSGLMIDEEFRQDLDDDAAPTQLDAGRPQQIEGAATKVAEPEKPQGAPGSTVTEVPGKPVKPAPEPKKKPEKPAEPKPAQEPAKAPEADTTAQPAAAPETTAQPAGSDTPFGDDGQQGTDPILEQPAGEAASEEPACMNEVFTAISSPEFRNKRIGDLSVESLMRANELWIAKFPAKIIQQGKQDQANWILTALTFRTGKKYDLLS